MKNIYLDKDEKYGIFNILFKQKVPLQNDIHVKKH